jgi:hypothetical protein
MIANGNATYILSHGVNDTGGLCRGNVGEGRLALVLSCNVEGGSETYPGRFIADNNFARAGLWNGEGFEFGNISIVAEFMDDDSAHVTLILTYY